MRKSYDRSMLTDMISHLIRKIQNLNRRQRKFLQFLSLVGFTLCLIAAIYAFSTYQNFAPPSPLPKPPVVAENSSSVSSPIATALNKVNPKNHQNCGSPSGGPTDNPIAAKYGQNAYPWTEEIKWDCVYNLSLIHI